MSNHEPPNPPPDLLSAVFSLLAWLTRSVMPARQDTSGASSNTSPEDSSKCGDIPGSEEPFRFTCRKEVEGHQIRGQARIQPDEQVYLLRRTAGRCFTWIPIGDAMTLLVEEGDLLTGLPKKILPAVLLFAPSRKRIPVC